MLNLTMNEKVREDQVVKAKEAILSLVKSSKLPREIEDAAIELGQYAIVPNDLFDPELDRGTKDRQWRVSSL